MCCTAHSLLQPQFCSTGSTLHTCWISAPFLHVVVHSSSRQCLWTFRASNDHRGMELVANQQSEYNNLYWFLLRGSTCETDLKLLFSNSFCRCFIWRLIVVFETQNVSFEYINKSVRNVSRQHIADDLIGFFQPFLVICVVLLNHTDAVHYRETNMLFGDPSNATWAPFTNIFIVAGDVYILIDTSLWIWIQDIKTVNLIIKLNCLTY